MKNETALGHVLTLMTIIIWGTTFVSTKVLLEAFTPIEILFFRFTLGYLSLWAIYPRKGTYGTLRQELLFAAAGLCGVTLYFLLENIALNDPYFIEKKLYPNVDFYSGIILKAMGIPSSMFTVIFAMARTVGWIAHWSEMHSDGMKIARPRQLYTGYAQRDFKSDIKK